MTEFIPSLKKAKFDVSEFKKALQLATRCCYYQKIKLGDKVQYNCRSQQREKKPVAGQKPEVLEVRQASVDVRETLKALKARLP